MQKSSLPAVALVCGILSWLVLPFVLGIVAWIAGHQALVQMERGEIDDKDQLLAQIGKILGMANVLLALVGMCFALMFFGGLLALIGIQIGQTPSLIAYPFG